MKLSNKSWVCALIISGVGFISTTYASGKRPPKGNCECWVKNALAGNVGSAVKLVFKKVTEKQCVSLNGTNVDPSHLDGQSFEFGSYSAGGIGVVHDCKWISPERIISSN